MAQFALAADKPDMELLEFLGSVDSGGEDWSHYLESTDLDRVASKSTAVATSTPKPTPTPSPSQASKPAASTTPAKLVQATEESKP